MRTWLLPALAVLLTGCSAEILDPKGPIGQQEKTLLITATLLMLIVVIPVLVMAVTFAWKYRASAGARYEPDWGHSNKIEAVIWTIPCIIIAVLAVLTWRSSHALDPYKPLESNVKPVTIEAVALDWKWLFIYPEQGIATVNEIAFPVGTPVNFKITSDTVMNSFFIPQLGTQIYAMAGMETKLHLQADEAGDYRGISANYSGHGFSGMNFVAHATSNEGFDAWVAKVKASQGALQQADFAKLSEKNEKRYPATYYGSVDPLLYRSIIDKYMSKGTHIGHGEMVAVGPVCSSGE